MEKVRGLLGSRIRVLLTDGRIVEGELECMDKDINLVMKNTKEFHNLGDKVSDEVISERYRSIGTAMIPGAHVVQCFAMKAEL